MCRITDPEKSRAFYEALGFTYDLGSGYGTSRSGSRISTEPSQSSRARE
jgi:hypothetical protein